MFDFLWDKDALIEGSYANKDKLEEMVAWNTMEINSEGGHGKIFELSWTLTTQDSDIVKTLLDPLLRTETLKMFALEADAALDGFAQDFHNYMLGNILLLDWWEYSNVVELVIEQNMRLCSDDPKFIATKTNGQFCRNYFSNQNCTNVEYREWMSIHCRLSCGYC